MEALAEQIIATYLTRGGKVFIVPQYPIPSDLPSRDWACPDFVALNFERPEVPEVVVVEVASGACLDRILAKAKNREEQWFRRLRTRLKADGIIDDRWTIRFLGFVRKDNLKKARAALAGESVVAFCAIEDAAFSWDYWADRIGGGLPR